MRFKASLLVVLAVMAWGAPAFAQAPDYGLGRAPTDRELKAWDLAIGPEGKELPPGSGTAKQGVGVFVGRGCSVCHGPTQIEGPGPRLVGNTVTISTNYYPLAYWPFATTIWDYINRAMPLDQGGLLTANEVYAVTAFLLYRNDIIKEDEVMDATTLPKVQMPHRDGFVPPPLSEWKPGMVRPFKAGASKQ